jgi:hypothetical protein
MSELPSVSLPEAIRKCGEAITAYRINRPELLSVYEELLNAEGGPWEATCKRDVTDGAISFKGTVFDISPEGLVRGQGIAHDNDPHAPFRDFKLIDSSGAPAPKDSPVFLLQRKLQYFMEQVRVAVGTMAALLPMLETLAPQFGIDPSPLTQLRHRLPELPYIPVRKKRIEATATTGESVKLESGNPRFSIAERDRQVAEDAPFLSSALMSLEHLLQAHWRVTRMVAQQKSKSEGAAQHLSEIQQSIVTTIANSAAALRSIEDVANATKIYQADSRFRGEVATLKRFGIIDKRGGRYVVLKES